VKLLAALGLCALHGAAGAFIGRVDLPAADAPFTNEAVVRGVSASRTQCESLGGAVWAEAGDAGAECLRYWHAGLGSTARALVYFSGDLLVGDAVWGGYTALSPASLQKTVDAVHGRLGVPYVVVARPGTFGSSGEHKQRRRPLEARLVSAALDAINQRHGLQELALAGTSGGGHVVASLVGWRSDVVCAVPASAVSMPKLRVQLHGWSMDATGHADTYEPADNLDRSRAHPKLRVLVVGDPQDRNVPWRSQTAFADRLRAGGYDVDVLQAEGRGPERHSVVESALVLGAMCLQDLPQDEIRRRTEGRLKG
jgi:hypothetical protein